MKSVVAILFFLAVTASGSGVRAQCTTTISSFPYSENFEADNGNWASGGAASSWQWGIISKPVITAAGSGQRAWTTGRITGGSYNDGEDSWLRSPCFNFSGLVNPMISFKIFWETERQFDGASIEYSTNGGTTWSLLGSQNSNTNCDGENWFNFSPVRYLGNEPGWSGNVQPSTGPCVGGGGSGAWLTAKHKLSFLAGRTSVRFRFRFGAGTSCNQYDGLAIDDVRIEEVPPNPASFTYQCAGGNSVNFTTVNKVCQTGVTWNFDDPSSGTNNSSTSFTPTHVFSAPGTYNVSMTATFRNAPTATSTQTVVIAAATTSVSSPILCNGGTGSASVVVVPGGTYNYSWNSTPPQTSSTLTNVRAGTYTVTISGTGACISEAEVTLTEPPALTLSLTPVAATCAAGTGSIVANVTGGTGPYTYTWSDGSTGSSINNKAPGTYTLNLRDANGCTATSTATIAAPVNNIQVVPSITDAFCGINNGAISVSVSGGTSPYTYLWSNGGTTPSITGLAPGNYSLTVRDAAGCSFTSSTFTVSNNDPAITITPDVLPAQCSANNGSITLIVSGGTAPYSYLWSNGETNDEIVNIAPGNYSVTVTDGNGCSASSGTITVGSVSSSLAITPQTTPAQCSSNSGSISVIVTGGTAPYSYLWSNGATTAGINNLAPGSYQVSVTDANGCSGNSGNVSVGTANSTITVTPQITPSQCGNNNGAINVNAAGGTAPYVYTWSNGATTAALNNLSAGNYSLTVTDANGCTSGPLDFVVTDVTANILIQPQIQPAKCLENNGSIMLTISGGTAPYSFLWNTGASTQNLSLLPTGNYSVDVTDANGCTKTVSNITVTRSNNSLNVNLGQDRNYCPGMSVTLSPGNGFSSYLWQNGSTSSSLNVTQPGTYTVTVTDAAGCRGTDSVIIYSNCSDLYFPSAFTPNGDGLNEAFGALGDFTGLRDYTLVVYGRWGQEIFRTSDPSKKWDGTYKGKMQGMTSYVFTATYTIGNRLTEVVKGTIILIR